MTHEKKLFGKKIDFKINNAKKNKIGIYVFAIKIVVEKERKKKRMRENEKDL